MNIAPNETLAPSGTAAKPTLRMPSLRIVQDRLWLWGRRSAVAIIDQGLTAAAGFIVNFLLARWLSPNNYGAFAVSFAGFLFFAGFHNVLLLEPMSVVGPSRYAEKLPEYFRAQILVHLILVGGFSALVLPATLALRFTSSPGPLVGSIVGAALALPFMLLLWLARRACYAMHRANIAVAGSLTYLLVVAAGLMGLHQAGLADPFSAFILMGSASLIAAWILLRLLGIPVRVTDEAGPGLWRSTLRENWKYGRLLVGSALLFFVANQTQMVLIPFYLGLGSAGVLRAMQIPTLVMTQVIGAVGLLLLPTFSFDFGRGFGSRLKRKAVFVSLTLAGFASAFAGVLFAFAVPLEKVLYGGRYSQYSRLIPLMALIPIANAFAVGFSSALRAAQKTHFDLIANAVGAPVCVLSAIAFIHWWGLQGAAFSMVLSSIVISLFTCFFFVSIRADPTWNKTDGVPSEFPNQAQVEPDPCHDSISRYR